MSRDSLVLPLRVFGERICAGRGTLFRTEQGRGKGAASLSRWATGRRFGPPRYKVKGLLTLNRRLLPLVDRDRPLTTFPAIPTAPFKQVEFGDAFQSVELQRLWLENIFHFSQATFILALTVFGCLLVSVKVGSPLRDGDGWWERKLTSAPNCCLRDEPSQMLRTDLLEAVEPE